MSHKTNENSEDVLLYVYLGNGVSRRIPADKITYVSGFDDLNIIKKIIHPQIYPSKFADVILNKKKDNE